MMTVGDRRIEHDKAQKAIDEYRKHNNDCCGDLSDGYHTFDELYHHRALLFASLCMTTFKNIAWKSLLHHDPNDPMYPGMFIVGIDTKYGQASYHYNIDPYWSIFKEIREVERAPKFDGHTPSEAIDRIYHLAFDIATSQIFRTHESDSTKNRDLSKKHNISTFYDG